MSLSQVCSYEQANAEITLIDQSASPFGGRKKTTSKMNNSITRNMNRGLGRHGMIEGHYKTIFTELSVTAHLFNPRVFNNYNGQFGAALDNKPGTCKSDLLLCFIQCIQQSAKSLMKFQLAYLSCA